MKMNLSTTALAKKIAILMIVSAASLLFIGCGVATDQTSEPYTDSGKLKVAASFYPLAEFAQHVGGEKVEVFQVIPSGVGAHDFEPSAKDIIKIQESKILLINGAGLDPWAQKIKTELEKYGVTVIDMSDHININVQDQDPHFWLDPVAAITEITIIRDSFIKADPGNKETYIENAQNYMEELDVLHKSIREELSECEKTEIITAHTAFNYLADRYGFEQVGISGLSSQEEPSARRLAELVDLAKEKEIKYIFFESMVNPKSAETLANEIGAETLVLNPISSLTQDDIDSGKNYVKLMQENLDNLSIALECQKKT